MVSRPMPLVPKIRGPVGQIFTLVERAFLCYAIGVQPEKRSFCCGH